MTGVRFLLTLLLAGAVLFLGAQLHAAQAEVRLNKTKAQVVKGHTIQLKVKGTSEKVKWKVNKKKIISVNQKGEVTGKKSGTAKVIAKVGGVKYTCKITVMDAGDVNTKGAEWGIDVSVWQGKINFKKVKKAGVQFVIIRAGHGTSVDSKFKRNYKKAKAAGLKIGVYWFSTAQTASAAVEEAQRCLNVVAGRKLDMPIFFDLESTSQFSKGKSFCTQITVNFCNKIKNAGYKAGLYSSRSFLPKYVDSSTLKNDSIMLWVAEHGKKNNYSGTYDIWQYSHTGRVDGINAAVDLNWYFPNAGRYGSAVSSSSSSSKSSSGSSSGSSDSTTQTETATTEAAADSTAASTDTKSTDTSTSADTKTSSETTKTDSSSSSSSDTKTDSSSSSSSGSTDSSSSSSGSGSGSSSSGTSAETS